MLSRLNKNKSMPTHSSVKLKTQKTKIDLKDSQRERTGHLQKTGNSISLTQQKSADSEYNLANIDKK